MLKVATCIVTVWIAGSVHQDWNRANAATIRLDPFAIQDLPGSIQRDLVRRGCTVPQTYARKSPHNVIRGRFTSSSRQDVAVLCSKAQVSRILVFRGGATSSVVELASRPDSTYLQTIGDGEIGFSRFLGVADAEYILEHYRRYGGTPPPTPLDHDGLTDAFIEKGSVVWYFYKGRWLQLTGSD